MPWDHKTGRYKPPDGWNVMWGTRKVSATNGNRKLVRQGHRTHYKLTEQIEQDIAKLEELK